jgi:integrase
MELNAAIEDGLIVANPAANQGQALKLTVSKTTRQEEIKAMTKAQRQHFLATVLPQAPHYYPLFFVLAGTGMQLGEALALQDGDLDLNAQTIRIARAFAEDGTLEGPKSGHGRTVDLSQTPHGGARSASHDPEVRSAETPLNKSDALGCS